MSQYQNKATKLVHVARDKKFTHSAVNPVIQRASSLVFDNLEHKRQATIKRKEQALFYGRRGTLTHFALQDAMCELENGAGCYLFPCGAAAVTNTIAAFVSSGDHILVSGASYEPTQEFCNDLSTRYNIETTYFDPMIGDDIRNLVRPNTKVLFLEAPSSITMEVSDIPAIVNAVRSINPDIVIMIDNTWSAGVFFPALEFGIDVSIQAGTKYLVGHSDVMIGTTVANKRCWPTLREHAYLMGQMVDADSAYMTTRGLRTLMLRLKQHEESAIKLAQWLSQQPQVKQVFHPALPSCPGHEYFKRDFKGSCGLFSFELKQELNKEQLSRFMDNFSLFSMAYSWGGFESLILYTQPDELKRIRPNIERHLSGTLIRVHVGLENIDDLINDLAQGLQRI